MRKITSLLLALVCTVGAWADVTDLPELSTAENPVYYVIHNTRSVSGSLIYFDGSTIKDNNPVELGDKYQFYFTDAGDGKVKICNKATNLKLTSPSSWTEEGANCVIGVTPHSSMAGLFIQFGTGDYDYLNEQNFGPGYTNWSADDAGSIFTIERVEDVHMPVAGGTYTIANPIFIGNQGVVKGMTVADADATKATWKTVMYSTGNDQWVYNTNSEGKMSLKNVATNKYLNGASLSDTEVFGDLKYLGCGQFNIIVNGATCHAAGHSSGAGSNGDVVSWAGGIGSASAWTIREATEMDYISVYSDFYAPIDITTDDANPKYFSIKSGRGDEKWYTYTSDDQKIALQAYTESDDQLWYFKGAVADDGTVLVRLFCKSGEGKAMSYENTASEGAGLVVAKELDTNGFYNTWKLIKGSNGITHVRLQTYDGVNYLSNFGGANNKMGLYKSSAESDAGTQMYIYTPKTMYQELVDMISTAEAKTAGTDCGYYKPTEAYTTALNTAKSLTSAGTVLASFNALCELRNAANGLEVILPEAGKFYRIAYDYGGETGRKYLQGKASTVKGVEYSSETGAASIFYYDGSKLLSFTAGEYLRENDDYRGLQGVGVEGGNVTFEASPRTLGKLCIKLTSYLHANSGNGNLYSDHCSGNGCSQHDHIVETVTWLPVPMNTEAGYATLYSPVALDYTYNNEERVKAYTATAVNNSQITLTECANGIPANTPVILKYVEGGTTENGCVYLHISDGTITAPEEVNKLQGTFAAEYITDDAYVLAKPTEKETGLYKATKNQSNNTAWKNNGFKAYLPANMVPNNAPALTFDFGTETGIGNIGSTENAAGKAVIYDLSGRRVKSAQKGIFIINGKKVVK